MEHCSTHGLYRCLVSLGNSARLEEFLQRLNARAADETALVRGAFTVEVERVDAVVVAVEGAAQSSTAMLLGHALKEIPRMRRHCIEIAGHGGRGVNER